MSLCKDEAAKHKQMCCSFTLHKMSVIYPPHQDADKRHAEATPTHLVSFEHNTTFSFACTKENIMSFNVKTIH